MAEHVTFTGARGQALPGIVDLPDGPARSAALVVHCFAHDTEDRAVTWIARALAEDGYVVLRVDLSGGGGEEAVGVDVADLGAAADYLRSRHVAPAVLVGHSLGGCAVIAAAEHVPEARAVVTIGAPADPERFLAAWGEGGPGGDGRFRGALGGHEVVLDHSFLQDVRARPQPRRLAKLRRALLVLHSPEDAVVGIDDARRIFDAAHHPKSFVGLDGADHHLSRPRDARFAAHVLAAWAARYVEVAPAPATSPPGALAAGLVQVRETGAGRFQQEVRVGAHAWTADEPVAAGGDDAGPSPYDLLLAGLGTCTSMTLRMYVERKGWDVGAIDVVLRHDRVPDEGLGLRGGVNGRVDRVRLAISVDGELDEAQRESILRIAGKCPVHRTLTHDVIIETEVAEQPVAEPLPV
jgi:putative redox protein